MKKANALCDRVAIVDKGKLVVLDTPSNLKRRYGDTIIDIETTRILSQSLLEKIRLLSGVSKVIQNEHRIKVAISGDPSDDGDENNGSYYRSSHYAHNPRNESKDNLTKRP